LKPIEQLIASQRCPRCASRHSVASQQVNEDLVRQQNIVVDRRCGLDGQADIAAAESLTSSSARSRLMIRSAAAAVATILRASIHIELQPRDEARS
jgi:hypothetical protein